MNGVNLEAQTKPCAEWVQCVVQAAWQACAKAVEGEALQAECLTCPC